jgi:hypothetical protein
LNSKIAAMMSGSKVPAGVRAAQWLRWTTARVAGLLTTGVALTRDRLRCDIGSLILLRHATAYRRETAADGWIDQAEL